MSNRVRCRRWLPATKRAPRWRMRCSGGDEFAAKGFHAEPFADAVAAVSGAALSFFMSHGGFLTDDSTEC